METVTEIFATDAEAARALLPAPAPMVFRGLVRDWPVVRAARTSTVALVEYLTRLDRGRTMTASIGGPEIRGRFFYNDDLSGLNFRQEPVRLAGALARIEAESSSAAPAAIAIQSTPVRAHLPDFEAENPMPLLDPPVEPRLWLGNRVTIAAHHDPSENIACVAAGRRRFTLFPPEQVGNLYIGPYELTPAGPTVSMVDFDAPDFARHPRFADALAAALTVDLEPGDALYIPYLWWHHVRSLDPVNLLVNYWWGKQAAERGRPLDALLHALIAIKDLPEHRREAWRAMFDHYVFQQSGPPAAHLPEERRGVIGEIAPERARELRHMLARTLSG